MFLKELVLMLCGQNNELKNSTSTSSSTSSSVDMSADVSKPNTCAPDKHEYEACYSSCPSCIKGYAICSICDGDGSCIGDGCDKGLAHCQTKGCKYGYIYQTHYCIKCGNAKYIK